MATIKEIDANNKIFTATQTVKDIQLCVYLNNKIETYKHDNIYNT